MRYSLCPIGEEAYITFQPTWRDGIAFHYVYRHINNQLFFTITPTIEEARERRDAWLLMRLLGMG
jgi:hypothetical protein